MNPAMNTARAHLDLEDEIERNRTCIEARKAAGVANPENIDIDCESECPIRLTSCPFGTPKTARS